jgi:hypothetical protein
MRAVRASLTAGRLASWQNPAVKFRTLAAAGAVITVLVGATGAIVWQLVPDDENAGLAVLFVTAPAMITLLALVGLLAGWFGRDRDEVTFVVIVAGVAAAGAMAVVALVSDRWPIGSAAVAAGVVAVGGAAASLSWRIGDLVCEARDLPTYHRLAAPAFVEDFPGNPLWTTDAGPAIRAALDDLAAEIAPGEPVDARAVGIEVGLPRERPILLVLSGGRLAIRPVTINGSATGTARVFGPSELAEVSIRSESLNGAQRRSVNAFDDLISLRTSSGARLTLRLPYGTRGAGSSTGGPDEIRSWLRANARTYV